MTEYLPPRSPLDPDALRLALALIQSARTVSGVTLILPTGRAVHIDAETIRQGGRA